MERLTNFHVLKVIALGATNHLPARVKIVSERFNESVIINYSNDPADAAPAIGTAQRWLTAKGFTLIGMAEGKDHYYIMSTTFEPLKK